MKVLWILLLAGFVGLSGCGKQMVKVFNDYPGNSPAPKKVAVLINPSKIVLQGDIASDVTDDLPMTKGQPVQSVYLDFLKKKLEGEIKKNFPGAVPEFLPYETHQDQLESVKVQYGKNDPEMDYRVPASPEKFKQATDAQLVLIISGVTLNRRYEVINTGVSKSTSNFLSCQYDYSVWDNTAGKLVSTGSPLIEITVFMAMTTKTWESNIQEFMDFVVKNPPMGKKQQK